MRRAMPLLAILLACCGPIGPIPGGALRGDVAAAPVSDWSFTDAHETAQLETDPDDPHSVNTWMTGHAGALYVPTSLILGVEDPAERGWVQNVGRDPRVRIRIDGVIYERVAVRVTDATELEAVRAKLIAKYDVEASDDGQEQNAWIYRLDPR